MDKFRLLENVHTSLTPVVTDAALVRGDYMYYHYGCDGVDDRGWGCGYRTLQTMCSWIRGQRGESMREVPSLRKIQNALVAMDDKPDSFAGSKNWIGSFEICICIDYFYEVPCRLIHVTSGEKLIEYLPDLQKHFQEIGSVIMMGKVFTLYQFSNYLFCGDTDNASKGIVGVSMEKKSLLVIDPHYYGDITTVTELYDKDMSGYGLKDVYISPGPSGSVIFENQDILKIIEVAKSLPPVWSKHAHMGFFGTFTGEQRINIKLDAIDPEGTDLHFMIVSGDLPQGVSLNNVTGYIEGVIPDVEEIFKFGVRAIDEHGKYADAIFKMETVVKDHCQTNPCLHGGSCTDTKGWFNCTCRSGYGGPRCEFSCASQALGVSDKNKIPDAQMSGYLTYSSYLESNGRYRASGYGWVGSNSNSWLQVDLGNLTKVYAVRNQGYSSTYYSRGYTLSVSTDGTSFLSVNNTNGGIHTFSASTGNYQYSLPVPVDARFVRFHPTSYHTKPQFKVELYGCHYQ
ncbi:uncharacterized protein LOC134280666 [Saccostrea cucullata]|uniref:uncharacterized protein LOC134280666 n=1 Tax=Saccostrea cuccullata TaxID=36930 RepID=UPI002ED46591